MSNEINTALVVDEIATSVNAIQDELAPILKKLSAQHEPVALCMALSISSAHVALHDGASEEDFGTIAGLAWEKSQKVHSNCGKSE